MLHSGIFPLESLHQHALAAAEAAKCAGDQNKFWEMHDALFRDQKELDDASIQQNAAAIGLDGQRFKQCLRGGVAGEVRADVQFGKNLRVSSTPTFLIGVLQPAGDVKVTGRVVGTASFERFKTELDKAGGSAGAGKS